MSDVLATWDDFAKGHWGNVGPISANEGTWGGVNMLPTVDGAIVPISASRWLLTDADPVGKMWGMFWAYGADGRLYYIQQAGTSTTTSNMYRFSPDITSLPNTLTTTSTFTFVPTTDPDWVESGTTVYVTMYGNKTYTIATGANTMVKLTGNYGDAPAGRCITKYNEYLMIGGLSDARFGTHTNRIAFSGDTTGYLGADPDTTDRTAWEDLNYFNIGTDGDTVVGLYNLRDYLVVIMDDQSIYLVNGTPNVNLSVRRVTGFNKGSGGLTAFLPSHGAVDPAQTRAWFFDHSTRQPARFNGSSISHLNQFGIPHADRTGTDLVEGATTMIGGPDEFVMHGVALNRAAGEAIGKQPTEMVRLHGTWAPVLTDTVSVALASQSFGNLTTSPDIWYRFQEPAGSTSIEDWGASDGATLLVSTVGSASSTNSLRVSTFGVTSGTRAIEFQNSSTASGSATSAFGTTSFYVVMDVYTPATFNSFSLSLANSPTGGYDGSGSITVAASSSSMTAAIQNTAGGSYLIAGGATSFTVGWHRIIVTYTGGTLTIYNNGVQVGVADSTTTGTVGAGGTLWTVIVAGNGVIFQNVATGRRALGATDFAYLNAITVTDGIGSMPFLTSNDRYQVIACHQAGTTTMAPLLRYWYAGDPLWDADLSGDTANPPAYLTNEYGTPVYGSLELPAQPLKDAKEGQITGILVEFTPFPADLRESEISSAALLGFTARVEGWGLSAYNRTVTGSETSGVIVSTSLDYTTTIAAGNSDSWPNVKTAYLPVRPAGKVRDVRVVFTNITGIKIRRVQLLGDLHPIRNV